MLSTWDMMLVLWGQWLMALHWSSLGGMPRVCKGGAEGSRVGEGVDVTGCVPYLCNAFYWRC